MVPFHIVLFYRVNAHVQWSKARLFVSCRHKSLRNLIFVTVFLLMQSCSTSHLQRWHEVSLDTEFKASMEGQEVRDFSDYLVLEERLFAEMQNELMASVSSGQTINRYSPGSLSNSTSRKTDWNRTHEWAVDSPRGGILMMHGLTDSPYSMRSLGERLAKEGFHVIALRLPGHGTAPASLSNFKWQDVSAAMRIALRYLASTVDDKPVHLVGYSFGAPLAINLSLDAYERDDLTVPKSLVLISPAIGVTRAAAFAGPIASLSSIPGLRATRWSRIVPEFDPYKYNSFTFNAGAQVYKLGRYVTSRLNTRRKQLKSEEPVLPPVVVFQSTLDTTISAQAIIDRLFVNLNTKTHELVLFDLNRLGAISELLIDDPGPFTARTLARENLPFTLSLITNRNDKTSAVELRRKGPMSTKTMETIPLEYAWPDGIFSLSHISLPIPPDDPLYGATKPPDSNELFLSAGFMGETGQLEFPASWLMRLRYNPFYDYLEQRTVDWITTHD